MENENKKMQTTDELITDRGTTPGCSSCSPCTPATTQPSSPDKGRLLLLKDCITAANVILDNILVQGHL
jgi:hypothetical protein